MVFALVTEELFLVEEDWVHYGLVVDVVVVVVEIVLFLECAALKAHAHLSFFSLQEKHPLL